MILCLYNVDTLNICMEESGLKKIFLTKWQLCELICGYNADTLNICMKEFLIFVCTDSTEIFFSKLRSAGLNCNLPSFFTDSYCAGGI